jgi:hypothetical protein
VAERLDPLLAPRAFWLTSVTRDPAVEALAVRRGAVRSNFDVGLSADLRPPFALLVEEEVERASAAEIVSTAEVGRT